MTGIDNLAAQLQKTINEKDEGKKTGYDTQATVVKVSSDTIWVKIPGGVDETPVSKTVSAKEGDIVQVRVAGGRAWIVGNYTAPATDDTRAEEANTKAESADAHAAIAEVAAQGAQESAMTAQQAADVAKTRAIEAGKSAEEAKTMASEASAAAAKANTAANGAITSLGIVQGVVDGLSVDMDEMQTHVAMMDAVVDPDSGKTLVPAGLHVVPTSNGYFVVLSNDGMYVYDNESDLVAIFGENIKFDSIRPQRIGGDDAYIEYYDSNNDGKADSLRIVGANISSSTGIPTKVSELQNDSGYTTKTYVDDAVGDTATDLANYILSNDKAIDDLERQIDGAIDTWYYAVDPTTSNEPAKDWTTEALKEAHLRDLYFNTSNGHTWRWAKDGSTYKWIQIEDADAIKALADAAKAQTTADVKKRVFISQPTPPYDVGDLWVGGSNGDIKKCKTPKTESQSYSASDWELASKYTDDSSLNTYKTTNDAAVAAAKKAGDDAQADLDDYKDTVQETYATKTELTQTESSIKSEVSSTYATKSSVPTKVSQLTNDSKYATQTQAQGYANTAESNAKADATTKANAAEANAKADATTKANAAEANAKADTTEKLKSYSTTTQMNSAIEQKANSIALSVAQTEISKVEIGGRNLARGTAEMIKGGGAWSTATWRNSYDSNTYNYSVNDSPVASVSKGVLVTTKVAKTRYGVCQDGCPMLSKKITFSVWAKGTAGGTINLRAVWWSGIPSSANWSKNFTTTGAWQYLSLTADLTNVTVPNGKCSICYMYWTGVNVDDTCIFIAPKLEYGTQATDWTPAPEDLEAYTDTQVSSAKAEIKVTTDNISSEVSKKVGNSEIISKINQSAETVQIEAEKVEFKGSVVFNAIKSQTDAAYDAKGSASEASKIATSYITDIDSKNGITIKAVNGTISGSNTDTQNYIKLNADGLDIYKGGKSVAMYGDTARLGEATSARLTLGPEGLGLYDTNSVRYFNIESSVGATNTYVDRKITDVSGGTGAVTTDLSSDASVADIWSNLATGAEFFIRIAWFYFNSSGVCIATKEGGDSFKKGTTKTSNSYVKYTEPNTLTFTASYPSVSGASTVIRMAHLEVEYSLFGPVYQFCNNPTSSNGAYCFMTGNGVQTNYDYQTAVGRYNDPDFVDDGPEDYRGLFFVGGGASDAYRKNAMVVTHSDDPDGYGSDILIGLETDICNNDIDIAGYLSDLGWDLEVLVDK